MDPDDTAGTPARPREEICRSRNVNDHIGLITIFAERWSETFFKFERHEVINEAVIQADRLLREKYNPDKGTVSTFLGRFLFGRVEYALYKNSGLRKRNGTWRPEKEMLKRSRDKDLRPETLLALIDMIDTVHVDLRETLERIANGETIRQVVDLEFDTQDRRARDRAASELRRILKTEINRLNR